MGCLVQPVHTVPQLRHHPHVPRRPPLARPNRSETHATAPATTRLERSRSGARRSVALSLSPSPARRKRWQSLRHGRHVSMDGVRTRTSSLRVGVVGDLRNGTRLWRCKIQPKCSASGTTKVADRDDWRRSRDLVVAECLRGPLGDAGSGAKARNVGRFWGGLNCRKIQLKQPLICGGEGGIRTLDTLLTYTHFPGVRLQPLGHLSSPARGARRNAGLSH